jgi:hypothetical protein
VTDGGGSTDPPHQPDGRHSVIRAGAERYLLVLIVAFVVSVVGIRWFLQATGYPQVGGGELHVAHMLWGGLLLIGAAILMLVVSAEWALTLSALAAGAGTGLFIDEVGKFITASNDYFYPLAAPLIYGALLVIVLVFVLIRHRPGGEPSIERPDSVGRWEAAHLPRGRYHRLLVGVLALIGGVWLASLVLYLSLDESTIRLLIETGVDVPGDRVERPNDPFFYGLEIAVLGASGLLTLAAAGALAVGRESVGTTIAILGLTLALTAGALVSLYVEQISAILSTLINGAVLFGVVHYRNRFLAGADADASGP